MQFDDQGIDASQLEDRRGGRGGALAMGGGGLGIVGVILALLLGVNPFGSSDGTSSTPGGSGTTGAQGQGASDVATRCQQQGAIDQYDDCYVLKVFNEVNEVWTADLPAQGGGEYRRPTLVFFEQATQTGCGSATSDVGPFYCPADQRVYIDLGFLAALQDRFGAQGRYAQAYIVAHEVGHHLQSITGTEAQVRRLQQSDPSRRNDLSVRMELQADCYAGVYGTLADKQGNQAVTPTEVDEAIKAAAAVGDDRIQRSAGQRVNPETFTHGSSAQRQQWFRTGFSSGRLQSCSTFGT